MAPDSKCWRRSCTRRRAGVKYGGRCALPPHARCRPFLPASARLAFAVERAGLVELAANDSDRRIVQLLLTKQGRAEIGQVRHERRIWYAALLLGLDWPKLETATHVINREHRVVAFAPDRSNIDVLTEHTDMPDWRTRGVRIVKGDGSTRTRPRRRA